MREIVLDTETTGLDPLQGDRIVEIGAVELVNHMPTGRTFHQYINPERDMPQDAFEVHGLSEDFLRDKWELVRNFVRFVAGLERGVLNELAQVVLLGEEVNQFGVGLLCLLNDELVLGEQLLECAAALLVDQVVNFAG